MTDLLTKTKKEISIIDVDAVKQENVVNNESLKKVFEELNEINTKLQELEKQAIFDAKIVSVSLRNCASVVINVLLFEVSLTKLVIDAATPTILRSSGFVIASSAYINALWPAPTIIAVIGFDIFIISLKSRFYQENYTIDTQKVKQKTKKNNSNFHNKSILKQQEKTLKNYEKMQDFLFKS